MRPIRMSVIAMAFAAVVVAGTATAQDQPPPPGPSAGPMMGAPGPHGMMSRGGGRVMGPHGSGPHMCRAMGGHVDSRLAYLKTELKITADQEPLWQAYATASHDSAEMMLAQCTAMMSERGKDAASLPDRLDQHEAMMAAQLDSVRAMNKALKPLYAALSDSQKETADQLFWGPMGAM